MRSCVHECMHYLKIIMLFVRSVVMENVKLYVTEEWKAESNHDFNTIIVYSEEYVVKDSTYIQCSIS